MNHPTIAESMKLPFPEIVLRWDAKEIAVADRTGAPEPIQWRRVVVENGGRPLRLRVAPIPPNAHRVPIVWAGEKTPFCDRSVDYRMGSDRSRLLGAIRESMVGTPAEGIDPRVMFCQYIKECGFDTGCWNRNRFNVKSQGRVFVENFATLVADRQVWTTIPGATKIYALKDGVGSVDGYPGFDSESDAWRFLVETVSQPAYGDALAQLRIGGIEGLTRYAHAIGGVFSGSSKAIYQREFFATWNKSAQLCGAEWVR